MMGLAVLIAQFIALGTIPSYSQILLGFSVGFLLTSATMAINDYYDVDIDILNNPDRPIPSGKVSLRFSLFMGGIFSCLGLLCSALINIESMVIALIAIFLMIYYNTYGKKTGFFGNVIVSFCVALPFIFGSYSVGELSTVVVIFSIMAFLSNLGREIIKGIMDIKGDMENKVKTIAVVWGEVVASKVASIFFFFSIIISFIPIVLQMVTPYYLPLIALSDVGFILSSFDVLKDPLSENAKRIKNRVLFWMFLGLLGFISGSINV
jgi:geranylgeranylglycerol-phosphate geranylgeranyltransferase